MNALAEDPSAAHKRAEAAQDITAIVHLLVSGRLDEVNVYLATIETHEVPDLIIAACGLVAALSQELDETRLRHGEPAIAGAFYASFATWDGLDIQPADGQLHD